MKSHYWLRVIYVGFMALALLAAGCSPVGQPSAGQEGEKPAKPAQGASAFSIGSPGIGSGWYIMAVGISNLINKQSDIRTSVEATGGADVLARGVSEKRLDFATSSTLAAADAYFGRPPYNSRAPLRLIVQADPNTRNLIARADAGIKTPADLKGKKVLGKRRAVADIEELYLAILKAWGVPKDQVRNIETAEINEAIEALKLGTADAGVIPGVVGAATIRDLAEATPVVFIDLGSKMEAALKELNPAFFATELPAGSYRGVDKPVQTVAAGRAAFITRADTPEDVVYKIAKIIFSDPEQMKNIHTTGRFWTVENTLDNFPLPLHPGAVRHFKEIGKWTDALEKRQQELLK